MQDLIIYTLDNQIYTPPKENKFKYIDGWQCMINSFIMSSYFPWVCLILILNRKNLKKPVILILIANWFFRAIGDILKASMDTRPREPDTVWPFSQKNWYISVELAHIFWFLGEIIGDWYPLVRTKIVTNDKKKMRWVYITCGLYNLVKVGAMFCGLLNFPIDLKQVDKNVWITDDIIQYNIVWWSIIAVMQIASCLYDLSVINALNSYLVDIINDFRTLKKNVFLEKFKRISEFRIILSMMASLVFFPFVTVFVIYLIIDYKNGRKFYSAETDAAIEQLRIAVLDFNYALMYMDQILLRFYVKRTQTISKITTNNFNKKNSISKNFSSSPTQYNYKKMNSLNDLNELIIRQPSNIEKAKVASNTTYRTSLYSHDNTSSNNLNNQNSILINNENINYNNIIFNNNNNNNNNYNNNNNNNNFNNPYNDNIINYNNNNNYNNNQNIDISQINNFNNYPRRSLYYLNNLKINIIDENNH